MRTAVALILACLLAAPARADVELPVPLHEAVAVADRVMTALGLLGTPYRKRGSSPETGFDCSGFIGHVLRAANGIELPRVSAQMFSQLTHEVERSALAAGDLLFFRIRRRGVDHVAMYIGDGRFIHAPASGGAVRIESLETPYWQQRFSGARRVPVLPPAVDYTETAALPVQSP